MTIHERIDDERKKRGWSWSELADKAGLSKPLFFKWRTQSQGPDLKSIVKVANALAVSIDHLVGRMPVQTSTVPNDRELELLHLYRGDRLVKSVVDVLVKTRLVELEDGSLPRPEWTHRKKRGTHAHVLARVPAWVLREKTTGVQTGRIFDTQEDAEKALQLLGPTFKIEKTSRTARTV